MECLMGMSCKDFVILAADMTKTQSILVMKNGKFNFLSACFFFQSKYF